MRDFLNGILQFIGSESLTDEEFESIELEDEEYTIEAYKALDAILFDRESISTIRERLKFYFNIKGVSVEIKPVGKSNILVGGVLE